MKKKFIKNEFAHDCAKSIPKKGESWRKGYMTSFDEGKADMLKACGGCKKCYGKGYGTSISFIGNTDDFETRRAGVKPFRIQQPLIVYCTCPRGKQLNKLLEHGD